MCAPIGHYLIYCGMYVPLSDDDFFGVSDDLEEKKILQEINTISEGIRGLNVAKKFLPFTGKCNGVSVFPNVRNNIM